MAKILDHHKTQSAQPNEAEQRVLESAIRCFAAKGYAGASIREIVQNAGVTTPVLYYYFKSKEDLFCHLVEKQFEEYCTRIDFILNTVSGCRARLMALIEYSFVSANESPEMVGLLLQYFFGSDDALRMDKEKLAEERFMRIAEIMRQGVEDGEIVPADVEMLTRTFSGMMDMYIMSKSVNVDNPLDLDTAAAIVDLFLEGARPRQA